MFSTTLGFNGNAQEVINFYANVFEYEVKKEDIHKLENGLITHGEIVIYGSRLMISDIDSTPYFKGFTFSINLTNPEELKQKFDAMSEGAKIIMPLQKVEWSQFYGMLKDKFGVTWQFNLD
ncbi:MAG: VOC family protein [Streptococcaceae bacterium]|nr:VOC family protein [Streptococcaceae bacterium]